MDEQLKRRVMGAVIIVALVVIFVPMLFEERPDSVELGEIPALPQPIEQKTLELPKSVTEAAPAGSPEKPPVPESGYRIVPLDDPPPPPKSTQTGPAETPKALGVEVSAAGKVVGDGGEAPGVRPGIKVPLKPVEKPPSMGVSPVKAKPVAPKSGPPAAGTADRKGTPAAIAARSPAVVPPPKTAPAKSAVQTPKVSPPPVAVKPPVETKPATVRQVPAPKNPEPPASWVVQAGSFVSENNARTFTEKLRKRNLPARIYPSRAESGTIYRVIIGPALKRGRAEQIQKQILADFGIRAVIQPRR